MKLPAALALCLASALLAGCESGVGESVRSVLSPREAPRTRDFDADPRAAYAAAKAAAEAMGYHYVRGGPAQGELDELGDISSGDEAGSSRQISMKVRLSPGEQSGTTVSVAFGEIIESASGSEPGLATEAPLSGTPLYAVFFRNVQNALKAPAKE